MRTRRFVVNRRDLRDARSADAQALLQPLSGTGSVIDDRLAEHGFFGVHQVLVASPSSKTAYAAGHWVARRGSVGVVGLTSPASVSIARSPGGHGRVLADDEVGHARRRRRDGGPRHERQRCGVCPAPVECRCDPRQGHLPEP